MELTYEQKQAVESQNSRILVSAGAGSGKTAVLSSRVASIVEKGTPITKLLILTFTKAAASEMKTRIAKELGKSPIQFAREQAEEVESASITTLHGFANKILKQHFFELGIDPAFLVLDEGTAYSLQMQAIDVVMQKLTAQRNNDFFDLVDVFSQNRKDEPLKNAILKMHDFLGSLENPSEFIELAKQSYGNEICNCAVKFMIKESAKRATFFKDRLDALMQECAAKHATKLVDVLGELDLNLLRIKSDASLSQIRVAVSSYFAPSKIMRNGNEELAEQVASLKMQVKKFFDSLYDMFCVDKQIDDQSKENEICAKRILALINLCELVEAEYCAQKTEIGALDFSDLEKKLFELLQNKITREQIALEYDYLFVDEYQDTNRLQEAIYKNLGIKNVFFVGDVKQSIYGFRLAEPKIFQEARQNFRENNGEVIPLSENFRSHEGMIEFTNKLFEKIMTSEVGGEDYKQEGEMKKGGSTFDSQSSERSTFPRAKICAIKKAKSSEKEIRQLPVYSVASHNDEVDEKMSSAISEGRMLAKVLKELDSVKIFDAKKGVMRPVVATDIAILSSSRGEYLDTLLRGAEEQGYSFATDISHNIFEDCDMNALLSVLKLASNPKQDIPLVAALVSCFGGLLAEELANIKIACTKECNNFFEVIEDFLLSCPNKKMEDTHKKVQKLQMLVDQLRFKSSGSTVLELVEYLCTKTNFVSHISQDKYGDKKLHLLEQLKEQLQVQKSCQQLEDFLQYQEEVGLFAGDGLSPTRGIAMQDDDGNFVTTFQNIMVTTIHKSKGLEFPIVILVGAGRPFNRDDFSKDFLISRNLGIGISSFDTLERVKTGNLVKNAIRLELQKQLLQEDIRLLYVAITRAINHLVVIGVGDPTEDETVQKNILSSSCFFDLLSKFDFAKNWMLTKVSKDSFEMLSQKQILKLPTPTYNLTTNDAVQKAMQKAFDFEYPNVEATTLSQKYSVTEIAEMQYEKQVAPLSSESTTDIGNAYHHIMQFISVDATTDEKFEQEKLCLIVQRLVSPVEWALVDEQKIKNCLSSPLFKVLRNGKRKILREQEFLMRATAKEIGVSKTCEDIVLVQGVFDLIALDGKSVLVVDYKTGSAKSEELLIAKHKKQMELYKLAAERAFGVPANVAIYSFDLEKLVKIF